MFRAAYSAPFSSADVNTVTKTSSPQTSPSIPVLCEEGRPYLTDPVTARRLYACHLPPDGAPSHLHAHGAALSGGLKAALAAAHPAPGSVPPGPPGMEAAGPAAFYNPLLRGLAVRPERLAQCLTPSGHPIAFDPALAAHPYGLLYAGLDVNGLGMRKAATRETTGPLKAWLHEHRKNPYPTKAEKIMLAIITKMTLTQVSTWFANARRRLKKESRLYSGGPDTDHHDDHDDHDDQDDDLPPREDEERQGVDLHGCHSHSRDSDEDINVDVSDVSDTEDIVITTTTTTSPTTLHPSLTSPTTTATPKYHPHHHPHLHTSSSGLSPFPLTPSFPPHHHHHHPSAFLPRPVADLGGLCRVGVGVDVPPAPSPLQQQGVADPHPHPHPHAHPHGPSLSVEQVTPAVVPLKPTPSSSPSASLPNGLTPPHPAPSAQDCARTTTTTTASAVSPPTKKAATTAMPNGSLGNVSPPPRPHRAPSPSSDQRGDGGEGSSPPPPPTPPPLPPVAASKPKIWSISEIIHSGGSSSARRRRRGSSEGGEEGEEDKESASAVVMAASPPCPREVSAMSVSQHRPPPPDFLTSSAAAAQRQEVLLSHPLATSPFRTLGGQVSPDIRLLASNPRQVPASAFLVPGHPHHPHHPHHHPGWGVAPVVGALRLASACHVMQAMGGRKGSGGGGGGGGREEDEEGAGGDGGGGGGREESPQTEALDLHTKKEERGGSMAST